MKDKVVSSREGSKEETPQNLTPIFVNDLTTEIMQGNKTIEMFQAMAIVGFKMGILWENCVCCNLFDVTEKCPIDLDYN